MKYHRLGHIKPIKTLKQGDIVCSGDVVGENSTGNGQWAAHVHFDILTYEPTKWTEYVIGKSKEWVESHYADPRGLEKSVLPTFDHLGYGWLSPAVYGGKNAIHPGLDLNGKGIGNDDIGDPVHSPCTGVVRYVYHGEGTNEGWGGLLVIEEKIIEQPMKKEFVKAIEKITGEKYGDNINEKEQAEAAKKILDVKEKVDLVLQMADADKKKREELEIELQNEKYHSKAIEETNKQLEQRVKDLEVAIGQIETDSIDAYSLTELAGAFFRKLTSIKK